MQDQNDIEKLIQLTFDVGMAIHRDVGPGLMESIYENVLADRLQQNDVKIDRQQPVHVDIYGIRYDNAFR
jgi:GxxExxY protein